MIRYRNALAAGALLMALGLASASRAAIWVAPNGDDGNPGTEEQPLRTIERARDIVRTLNTSMTDDITVFISGLHQVTSPIEFGPEDSGSNGFSVVYTAAPGEQPAISGAVRVTDWTLVDKAKNLWSAPAPIGMRNGHELFVNGARTHPTRIRLPAAAEAGAPPPPAPQWKNPDDIAYPPPNPGAIWSEHTALPAYAVNVFEALGTPGAWCLDRPAHRIYYTPRPGEDMGRADAEVALAPALVVAGGSKHVPLTGLVFKGLRFEYTAPSSRTPAAAPDAAVVVTRAGSVQFLEDTFIHLSTPALSLGPGFEESAVTGCVFGDITWGALSVAWASQVTVSDNRFTYTSTGHADGSVIGIGHSQDVTIEHNQIDHYPASVLAVDGGAAGDLHYSQNLVAAPTVGIDAGPRQAPLAAGGEAGVTPAYHSVVAEAVIPRTAPDAPAGVSAEAEDGFAYVAWDPPTLDGGSDVVSYKVTASSGAAITVPAAALWDKGYAIVDGLEDGTEVSFTVSATGANGTSPESLPSGKVVPAYKRRLKVPKTPSSVSITLGMRTSEFRITPPASNGGSPVVGYSLAILSTGAPVILQGRDVLHADASHPVDRILETLVPGAGSTVEVRAINAKGQGDALEAKASR